MSLTSKLRLYLRAIFLRITDKIGGTLHDQTSKWSCCSFCLDVKWLSKVLLCFQFLVKFCYQKCDNQIKYKIAIRFLILWLVPKNISSIVVHGESANYFYNEGDNPKGKKINFLQCDLTLHDCTFYDKSTGCKKHHSNLNCLLLSNIVFTNKYKKIQLSM